MPIICQLCNQSFGKQINNRHLKYAHNITTTEYKLLFGPNSLSSDEYRHEKSLKASGKNNPMWGKNHSNTSIKKMSENSRGKPAWNKGLSGDERICSIMKDAALHREEKYKSSGHDPRLGRTVSEETKSKISNSLIGKSSATEESKQKSKNTKIKNGTYGLKPMLGKTLSAESRKKISDKVKIHAQIKRDKSRRRNDEIAKQQNITIIGYDGIISSMHCNKCLNYFEYTTQYFTPSKQSDKICPICRGAPKHSRAEIEILNYVRTLLPNTDVYCGNRSQIFPLELDIWIPNLSIAIEYCGLYHHCEQSGKGRDYHKHKLDKCIDKNIRLITIFEDEWANKKEIVEARLRSILQVQQQKVFARKCEIKVIAKSVAADFCNLYHIQGAGRTVYAYGLFYQNQLVSVMTFSKTNPAKGKAKVDYELNRFCSKFDVYIVGGASKLFKAFITQVNPSSVVSYCDLRWNTGSVYEQLGFKLSNSKIAPNYWYIDFKMVKRIHRYSMRLNDADDKSMTEFQNREAQGHKWIWDCGNKTYIWIKKIAS